MGFHRESGCSVNSAHRYGGVRHLLAEVSAVVDGGSHSVPHRHSAVRA